MFYHILLTESVRRKIDVIRGKSQSNGLLSCIPQPISRHYTNKKTRRNVFHSGRLYIHEKRKAVRLLLFCSLALMTMKKASGTCCKSLYKECWKSRSKLKTIKTNWKWLIGNIYRQRHWLCCVRTDVLIYHDLRYTRKCYAGAKVHFEMSLIY